MIKRMFNREVFVVGCIATLAFGGIGGFIWLLEENRGKPTKMSESAPEHVMHHNQLYKKVDVASRRRSEPKEVGIKSAELSGFYVENEPLKYWVTKETRVYIGDVTATWEQVQYLVNHHQHEFQFDGNYQKVKATIRLDISCWRTVDWLHVLLEESK